MIEEEAKFERNRRSGFPDDFRVPKSAQDIKLVLEHSDASQYHDMNIEWMLEAFKRSENDTLSKVCLELANRWVDQSGRWGNDMTIC